MLVLSVFLCIISVVFATSSRLNALENTHLGIVGGNEADIGSHPWQVSMQGSGGDWCSAFLISNEWLLTSAYCVYYLRDDEIPALWVRAGSNFSHDGGEIVYLKEKIVHPDFNKHWYINDIAAVRLASNITNSVSRPVNLPELDEELNDGTMLSVAGWGAMTEHGGNYSPILLDVQVPTVNRILCNNTYIYDIKSYMFCAGYLETAGKDVCVGDTGAPATIDNVAYGIASSQVSCGSVGFPGIYTRISSFRQWIKETTDI